MARRLRVEVPGGLYHVIVRGNQRKSVFLDDRDREEYLKRLAHYRERFEFELLAYCLMSNHVHLAIRRGAVPVSRLMLALQSSYTQWFNRRRGRAGHLFQGRYMAFLVDGDRHFLALLRYIHRNPVEAGIVAVPQQYRWTTDRYYRRGRGPDWVDVDRGLAYLASRRMGAVSRYRRLMLEEPEEPYEGLRGIAQVFKGDEGFVRRVLKVAPERELIRRSLGVETVARRVAESRGLEVATLRGAGRRRDASLGRAIVAHLAKSIGRIPFVRTAEYLNRDGSTPTRDIRTLEDCLRQSVALRKEVDRLAETLVQ